jgi:lipoprotein signal peptidase
MALKRRFLQLILFFIGMAVVTTIDQFLKRLIRQNGGFYVCNKGISFNIEIPYVTFWVALLFFIFIISICLYLYKKSALLSIFLLSLTLIGGGTASNGLDRLFFGCVFDYLRLPLKQLPLFNVADIGIFIGTCLLLFILLYKKPSLRWTTCE